MLLFYKFLLLYPHIYTVPGSYSPLPNNDLGYLALGWPAKLKGSSCACTVCQSYLRSTGTLCYYCGTAAHKMTSHFFWRCVSDLIKVTKLLQGSHRSKLRWCYTSRASVEGTSLEAHRGTIRVQ